MTGSAAVLARAVDLGLDDMIAAAIDRAIAGMDRTSALPSYREFYRSMTYPGGPCKGQHCDPDSDPAQRWVIEQMDAGVWERIFWCASPQVSGKTTVAVMLPICRNAIAARMPVGYALPTLRDISKAFKTKLAPVLRHSGYGRHFPHAGAGSRGGVPDVLPFYDPDSGDELGAITFCAGGAYGDTVAAMVVDEIDKFRAADGTPHWASIEDLWARCDSFGAFALRLGVGTVEDDTRSIILQCCDVDGTGTRMWPRCPHCGRHQHLGWDQVVYDAVSLTTARETARVACRHCAVVWSESDRLCALHDALFVHRGQSVQDGVVVGEVPETAGVLGLVTTSLESSLADIGRVVVAYLRAQRALEDRGDHDPMRKWTRYQRCRGYLGDRQDEDEGFRVTPEALAARFATRGEGDVVEDRDEGQLWSRHYVAWPEWATHAALSVDVQKNRMYWAVTAYSDQTWRRASIGWGYEIASQPMEALREADVAVLLSRIDRDVPSLWAEHAGRVTMRTVDTRYLTDEVELALRGLSGWRAIIGQPRISRAVRATVGDLIGYDATWRPGIGRYEVVTVNARERVHLALGRTPGEPLSHVLPRGLSATSHFLRHLCAWRLETSPRTQVRAWVKYQLRDDWLDVTSYNEAMIARRQAQAERPTESAESTPRPSAGIVGTIGR